MNQGTKRCLITCCIVTTITLLLLILTLVILYFTLLKPKQPEVTANPVSIRSIRVGLFPVITLQLTLGIDVLVTNRNYAGFKYVNTTTSVYYHGGLVGTAPIAAGEVEARRTENISTTVGLMVDKMTANPEFVPDVVGGMLNFSTASRVEGDVILLKVFKLHASTSVACDITVFLRSRNISSTCDAKIKI